MSAPEHGNLVFDSRDEWPSDAPIGTFDITQHGVEGYPGVTAHMIFKCPNARHCAILLAPQPIPRPNENALNVWGWDGNVERPTVTPSINCIAEKDGKATSGCGWHGFIIGGVISDDPRCLL